MKESSEAIAFGRRLREKRLSEGLNQAELADKAGLPPTAIAHFEGGRRKPSFDNVRRLAIALGTSADYLLGTPMPTAFRNEELLSAEDKEAIQRMIDRLTRSE
jgi:transcriptional regulator with XRE-family HTH domain